MHSNEAEMLAAMGRHARRAHRLTSPGTPSGAALSAAPTVTTITTICYGEKDLVEATVKDVAEIGDLVGKHPVTWVNVDGPLDPDTLARLGEIFKLHPLALEDVASNHQRPKVEDYGDTHFIITRMASPGDRFQSEQLSMFFGEKFVVTFQSRPGGDCLDAVRTRIRKGLGSVRKEDAGHLAYCILDGVIDGYFPVIDDIENRLDALEERILSRYDNHTPLVLHAIKRDLLEVRHTLRPLRDMVGSLMRDNTYKLSKETRIYLRDCYDHVMRILDQIETDRELCSDLMNLQMTSAGNRMNEVMKVLTIITTLFIPPTFIAGIYGMNFEAMPELKWALGYPFALGLMGLMVVGLIFFLSWKGWLSDLFKPRDRR